MEANDTTLTAQAVFDKTVTHLRAQGCRAYDEKSGFCKYRGPNGTKCAFGVHITDEEYSPTMENKSAHGMIMGIWKDLFLSLQRFQPHVDLLEDLQQIHDYNNASKWEEMFRVIARKYYLEYSPPQN